MGSGLSLYATGVAVVIGVAAVYWSTAGRRRAVSTARPAAAGLWLAGAAGLASCLWSVYLQRPALTYEQRAEPIAIAVAIDLSPSMLAIPDPGVAPQAIPRYMRGRDALLGMLRAMEERDQAALLCVVGFASSGNVIMGWNRNVAQAGEVLRHAVSPEVFGHPGTSMEAAASSLVDAFAMLPDTFAAARRLAIIVSDGEDTMREASFAYAVDMIARSGFEVISLQTGSLDVDEGIPVYDRTGSFAGFERVGGRLHTRPDITAMETLALAEHGRGLYLRAETPDAPQRMFEFAYGDASGAGTFDVALLPTLGMFGTVFLLLAWILR